MRLAARGKSGIYLKGRVTAKRGRIPGGNNVTTRCRDDAAMLIHCEESATTKTAPFRRNPLGVGGPPTFQTEAAGAPQALSEIVKTGHDEKTAPAASVSNLGGRSSLRACNPKTPARGPRDFCHGLLEAYALISRFLIRGGRSLSPESSARQSPQLLILNRFSTILS